MRATDRAQAEDEAEAPLRYAGLVGMGDDTRIEQRCRLERIFVQEIGADQPPLQLGEIGMGGERLLRLVGTALEGREQIAMPAFEIFQHLGDELVRGGLSIERQNAIDDVVGAGLFFRTKVARLDRGLERADDDAPRIGTQIKGLPVQEGRLRQDGLGGS